MTAMYFLPDQVEAYERFRITFKELAAQELFIRDESSAVQWLRQLLKDRPRTFADIQPLFMRELQSGLASWEELPDLREMLEANFVSDDKGRFAVPDPKKTEHLDQLRDPGAAQGVRGLHGRQRPGSTDSAPRRSGPGSRTHGPERTSRRSPRSGAACRATCSSRTPRCCTTSVTPNASRSSDGVTSASGRGSRRLASRSRYWRAPSCGDARWPRSSCRPPSTVDGSALPSSRSCRRGGGSTRR